MKKFLIFTLLITSSNIIVSCSDDIEQKQPDSVYQSTVGNPELGAPASEFGFSPSISSQIASTRIDLAKEQAPEPEYSMNIAQLSPQSVAPTTPVADLEVASQTADASSPAQPQQAEPPAPAPQEELAAEQPQQVAGPAPAEEEPKKLETPASMLYSLYKQKANVGEDAKVEEELVDESASEKTEESAELKPVTAPVNSEEPPVDIANVGECFSKVVTLGEYKEVEEDVLVTPAYTREVKVPAIYKEVEDEVVIKEASSKFVEMPATFKEIEDKIVVTPEKREQVVIPAKYDEVTERVMISPAQKVWKKEGKDGEIMKLVEEAAKYEDVTKKVLVEDERIEEKVTPAVMKIVKKKIVDQPARVEKQEVPAVTKKIKKQVLVSDATTEIINVPAVYKKEIKRVAVTPDVEEWQPVVCKENINRALVRQIQTALREKGFEVKMVDGFFGPNTKDAFNEFQKSKGYSSSGIALKTLSELGIIGSENQNTAEPMPWQNQ
jgi:hypothetical protein